jgi:hypothetical protein
MPRQRLILLIVVGTLFGFLNPRKAARDRRYATSWRGLLRETLAPVGVHYVPLIVNYVAARPIFVRQATRID